MTDQTCYDFPRTERLDFFEPEFEECAVEFRLIYKGSLPAEGSGGGRTKEKQSLRKYFHLQLSELWKQHPTLREQTTEPLVKTRTPSNLMSHPGPDTLQVLAGINALGNPSAKPWIEHVADEHDQFGYRFVPLITKQGGFTCSLDILFLRRDGPGNLVRPGGDIDNRIKVLFDGLKMPTVKSELAGDSPEEHEKPFFCLLEDDSLITRVTITTDRLLLPMESTEKVNDVYLVIKVTMSDPLAIFTGGRLV